MAGYRAYELWDGASLLATDAAEERLLHIVRVYHEKYGRDLVARWMLIWEDEDSDEDAIIAQGDELIARAFACEAAPT